MLRLVPAGGIACVYLLVVQQKQMSTRVNFSVARRGNVVVLLLRLDVQLREIFTTVACDWYQQRSVMRCCVLATDYPAVGSEDCVSYATLFEPPPLLSSIAAAAAACLRRKIVSGQFDDENPFVLISSVLLVQADEGVSFLVVDRIGDIYRNLPRRADIRIPTVVSEPVFFGSDHTNCRIVSNIEFQIKTAEISSHIDRPVPPHAAAPRRAPLRTLDARFCASDGRSLRARRASWPVRRAPGRASGRAALHKSLRGWSRAAAREEGGAGRDVARWGVRFYYKL
ncbi:hypothetical protein F511_39166 [Dorcoceras hygrometricum]|uniref:Uncharacterized protein n=1 Tax=Dorcoceras hygrometricum TaxID=472368 RepID=A0A2Z7B9W1_9LAMI|nr:hypothetical protein F511_39166 [Dorcoceras hygrometricum]